MIFGKGINDLRCNIESYPYWHSMIRRCYSKNYQKSKPTYIGTEVHPNWLYLSNFNNWFENNYVLGWHLDKDLLSDFGKLYSDETCCFLPNEINCALSFNKGRNGLPPGVSVKTANNNYVGQLSKNIDGKRKSIHLVSSKDPMVCFLAYKEAKQKYLQELAYQYETFLDKRAFYKLLNFEVTLNL